ncbi:MAG: hypothetical protein ABI894_09730 [Ilumatobacteraceae bacterium]
MRPIPKYLAVACSSALLVSAIAGCGGSDAKSSANTSASDPSSVAEAVTTVAAPTVAGDTVQTTDAAVTPSVASPVADPTADPCDLLTASVATQVLGVPVGEKITQPGEGNTTCAYRPADPGAQGIVTLTLYGVTGSVAVLDAAALEFPDAQSVDGLGDAARVSVQSQAIGVLTGSTVFALGLFPQQPDGTLLPITKDQLVAAARAVLDGQ